MALRGVSGRAGRCGVLEAGAWPPPEHLAGPGGHGGGNRWRRLSARYSPSTRTGAGSSSRRGGDLSGGAGGHSGVSERAAHAAVEALVRSLRAIDTGRPSRVVPLPGHYASVVRIDDGTGLALSTDTVGTKMV